MTGFFYVVEDDVRILFVDDDPILREFAQVLADAEHGSQLSEIRNPVFLRMAVE